MSPSTISRSIEHHCNAVECVTRIKAETKPMRHGFQVKLAALKCDELEELYQDRHDCWIVVKRLKTDKSTEWCCRVPYGKVRSLLRLGSGRQSDLFVDPPGFRSREWVISGQPGTTSVRFTPYGNGSTPPERRQQSQTEAAPLPR